jgi:sialic acid synthase SpsE
MASVMTSAIVIKGRKIGFGEPAYVIAEIGSNHNGELNIAKKLIEAANEAGADAVKFQAFRADEHYSKHTPAFKYLGEEGRKQGTYELIKSLEIDRGWHEELMSFCSDFGIEFLSSPCDYKAVDQLGNMGMPAFKLASFDLPDLDLIRYMAAFNRPLLLSTGMASYSDIQAALDAAKETGNDQVVLLQCTSLYPAPTDLSNLAAIDTMKRAFGVPVGYSDHTLGDHISIAAVALGACLIEKHFTLDRNLPGPDHAFAIEPSELTEMIRRIREVEAAIGDGVKNGPREAELEMFEKGRRSLHVIIEIKAGEIITKENLRVKRPGYGISPKYFEIVAGMKATRDIPDDHWIVWEDLK